MNIPLEAAVVAVQSARGVLLLRRVPHDRAFPNTWCFPGGRRDPGEDLPQTAKREVFEETGLTVALESVLGVYDTQSISANRSYRMTVYLGTIAPSSAPLGTFPTEEHTEAAWFPPHKALESLQLSGPVTQKVLEALAHNHAPS